jgi:hypothetical protein
MTKIHSRMTYIWSAVWAKSTMYTLAALDGIGVFSRWTTKVSDKLGVHRPALPPVEPPEEALVEAAGAVADRVAEAEETSVTADVASVSLPSDPPSLSSSSDPLPAAGSDSIGSVVPSSPAEGLGSTSPVPASTVVGEATSLMLELQLLPCLPQHCP